ncbi:MAG TPA: hypothetical protein VH415_08060 [Nitrososphaeraceae archaeon]
MNFFDDEGNIIVPKDVRPIIDYESTLLGSKQGAIRQYRYGNLHIREYKDYFAVHFDNVDPRIDALGHLMLDTPEMIGGILQLARFARKYLNSNEVI